MLSLPKLIVLVAILLIVWYGFKWLGRVERIRRERVGAQRSARAEGPGTRRRIEAEDLVQCASCGAYVAPRAAGSCGRPDCPYGR